MNIDWVRQYCLSLPHTTETVQWGDDLVFKIAGKMYAVAALEPGDHWLSFKCTPEEFARLVEMEGIIPAPYLAREIGRASCRERGGCRVGSRRRHTRWPRDWSSDVSSSDL